MRATKIAAMTKPTSCRKVSAMRTPDGRSPASPPAIATMIPATTPSTSGIARPTITPTTPIHQRHGGSPVRRARSGAPSGRSGCSGGGPGWT